MAAEPTSGEQPVSTRRVEAFTDGVFSIAATLLVLDLTIKDVGRVETDDQLLHRLVAMHDSFLSFAISFLLLCFLWSVHVRQFEYIERVDRRLIMLNTLRLLGVVLIPFTTSLNGEHSELILGRVLMPVNFLFVVAMGVVQWSYASSPRRDLVRALPRNTLETYRVNGIVAVSVGVVVVVLSVFIGPWAFFAYALNALMDRVFNRPGRKGRVADQTDPVGD